MGRTRSGFVDRIWRRGQWRTAASPGVLLFAALCSGGAFAQGAAPPSSGPPLSFGTRFTQTSGKDLYANICQGCHMSDGNGASGAGVYPSLVNNKKLEASGYPVYLVVNGQRAMPPFGAMLSNDQVSAVVNYLRTNFGNDYRDAVTAEDVKVVRP
jgi:mono/diheme cytochrome c family protein